MFTLRPFGQILPNTCQIVRFYARPPVQKNTNANIMKQVHKETLRYIHPTALIRVISDTFVKIRSADVHDYPGGNVFIAELHGGPAKNCPADIDVKISDDERNVDVIVKNLTNSPTDFHCELEIPIKASLDVTSKEAIIARNIYGDHVKIKSNNYISVFNVKAETVELECVGGNIISLGLLLGRRTKLETKNNGNIILDKLHGDEFLCKTDRGNITANCCYVESSTFETNSGTLDLQNIHKSTKVQVHGDGKLNMTGVHGNIKVYFNGSQMDLQLSELMGENYIKSDKSQSSVIKISDKIESSTSIVAQLNSNDSIITLDTTLQHLTAALHENRRHFKWPLEKEHPHKLQIDLKNSLTLGKSSWSDMLRLRLVQNLKTNNN